MNENIIPKVKLFLGIADTDTTQDLLLQVLIDDVKNYLINISNRTEAEIPESLIRSIVIIKYNLIGSEGIQTESYSGVSQTFLTGLPEDIKSQIKALRRLTF